MHSTALRPLVAELLEAHGHSVHDDESLEGRSGAVYHVPLVAESDRILLVEFKDSPDPVEPQDLEYLARLIDDAGADHAVLVHQGPAGHGLPIREDMTLWGPDRLRMALGDHFLHVQADAPLRPLPLGPATRAGPEDEVGDRPFQIPPPVLGSSPGTAGHIPDGSTEPDIMLPELTDDGFADLLPSAFQDPDDEDDAMIDLDFDALESLDAPAPRARPTAVPSPTERHLGPNAIRPRIPVHEARAMVKDRISRVERETLMLWPVHLVDYECDLMVDGTLKQDTVRGRIQVRGDKQGTTQVAPGDLDVRTIGTVDWGGAVDDHPFRRDADKALEDAKALVMQIHTKMVDMEVEDDASDFTMMERKKVAPDGDQIRLEHLAATYRPAWRFESDNGHVVIDALTGDTIDESLRTRSGDTIIVD